MRNCVDNIACAAVCSLASSGAPILATVPACTCSSASARNLTGSDTAASRAREVHPTTACRSGTVGPFSTCGGAPTSAAASSNIGGTPATRGTCGKGAALAPWANGDAHGLVSTVTTLEPATPALCGGTPALTGRLRCTGAPVIARAAATALTSTRGRPTPADARGTGSSEATVAYGTCPRLAATASTAPYARGPGAGATPRAPSRKAR